jgi:hypothetical protein
MIGRWLVVLVTLSSGAALAATPDERQAQIDAELRAEHYGTAVVLCEQTAKEMELTLELRAACAKAYVGLGDRLLASGSAENARRRWDEAAAIDPRLMDDPEFVKRLAGAPKSVAPDRKPGDGPAPVRRLPPKKKPPPRPEPRTGMPKNAGPRWDRDLGLGLSFGHDGLVALNIGWLTDETVLVEVTFGIVYPTADVRVRWLGIRHCLTPFAGLGLLVPFGESGRLGLDVSGYESLYELGEAFHVDLGLAYTPVHRLDLFAGISFLTPFDQDHPDTVLFFPQLTAGASWFF